MTSITISQRATLILFLLALAVLVTVLAAMTLTGGGEVVQAGGR